MLGLSKYLTAGALAVAVTAGAWGIWQDRRADRMAEALTAADARADAAERASEALAGHLRRIEAAAARANSIRTKIEEADHAADCPVPDWFADAVRGLRGGTTDSDPR